jgi:hypothetical protein
MFCPLTEAANAHSGALLWDVTVNAHAPSARVRAFPHMVKRASRLPIDPLRHSPEKGSLALLRAHHERLRKQRARLGQRPLQRSIERRVRPTLRPPPQFCPVDCTWADCQEAASEVATHERDAEELAAARRVTQASVAQAAAADVASSDCLYDASEDDASSESNDNIDASSSKSEDSFDLQLEVSDDD